MFSERFKTIIYQTCLTAWKLLYATFIIKLSCTVSEYFKYIVCSIDLYVFESSVHPEVSVDQQLVGVPIGSNVTLVCRIQAYPKPISYWLKHNTEMVIPTPWVHMNILHVQWTCRPQRCDLGLLFRKKYIVEEEQVPPSKNDYERVLRLTILNFDANDDAQYQCASQNTLGKMEKKIRVHGT